MYRQKNYWPLLKFAAGLSGLLGACFAAFAVYIIYMVLMHSAGTIGEAIPLILLIVGLSGVFGAGCIGIFTKRWWGRGIMTFVAVLYLFAFPVGTILSIFMLKALSNHKSEFR